MGRIIGKGGQNVREMQRLTGAVIKLPEQVSLGLEKERDQKFVISGNFYWRGDQCPHSRDLLLYSGESNTSLWNVSSISCEYFQSAQRRIRSLVASPVMSGAQPGHSLHNGGAQPSPEQN